MYNVPQIRWKNSSGPKGLFVPYSFQIIQVVFDNKIFKFSQEKLTLLHGAMVLTDQNNMNNLGSESTI